ncbi:MAG: isoprenylcysteine carboxylmethyltransferase family protein [Paracoccaceae bacterium]
MKPTLDYPPVWLIAFMGLAWGIAQVHAPFGDTLLWPGRLLIGAGIALAIWAALAFRHARTTIVPHAPPKALVDTGPFRYSRNPIYLADLVILAGWCVSLGAPLGLPLILPFWWVLTRRFIEPEEARLTKHLGTPYVEFCERVRRWL